MNKIEVSIKMLPPMRIACAYGFGESPEAIAWEKMQAFAKAKGLVSPQNTYPNYGFNNPSPSHGSPNYGYEIWVPVDAQTETEGEITTKDFPGGLYAVTRFKGISHIGEVWQLLVQWREDSRYHHGQHQCLEYLHNPFETDLEEYIFDLYLPISE
jgi:DNA gyrase inhibitor GyrI